jgi:hypothetical protein
VKTVAILNERINITLTSMATHENAKTEEIEKDLKNKTELDSGTRLQTFATDKHK